MAKHVSVLRQFRVYNDGAYGGGSDLEHDFGQCDWRECIDSMTLPQVMKLASGHAATCDGSPVPRRDVGMLHGGLVPELWSQILSDALETKLTSFTRYLGGLK